MHGLTLSIDPLADQNINHRYFDTYNANSTTVVWLTALRSAEKMLRVSLDAVHSAFLSNSVSNRLILSEQPLGCRSVIVLIIHCQSIRLLLSTTSFAAVFSVASCRAVWNSEYINLNVRPIYLYVYVAKTRGLKVYEQVPQFGIKKLKSLQKDIW